MRTLLQLGMLIAVVTGTAFAQDSQNCYGVGPYSVDRVYNKHYDATVCEFSSGRANVSSVVGDSYRSTWYTAEEWTKAKPVVLAAWDKAAAEIQAQNEVALSQSKKHSDAMDAWTTRFNAATSITSKKKCVAAGFVWKELFCQLQPGDTLDNAIAKGGR